MTKNYGIKVSKPGKDVNEASPQNLVFSSKYKTLKIHDRGSGTLTNASRTATIPHGLGYVPMFLVHVDNGQNGSYCIAPFNDSYGDVYAYADDTNLYIKADDDFGIAKYYMQDGDNDSAREIQGVGSFTDGWTIGKSSGGAYWYGAVRFPTFNYTSIVSATLNLYIANRDGSSSVLSNVWGIDEDNTGEFDSGTPATARAKTTAVVAHDTNHSQGQYSSVGVTGLINEILGRAGWSSGNAIGFMFWDDGTSNGNGYYQISSIANTNLRVVPNSNLVDYKYTIFLNQLE